MTDAPAPEVAAFNRQRRKFAVIEGALILCRADDVRDHETWFRHEGWSERFSNTTRGFIDSSGIYAYVGIYYYDHHWIENDLVTNADLLSEHAPPEAVVWSGMRRGEPGKRWDPVRRVGTLAELLERTTVISTPMRFGNSTVELLRKALGDDRAISTLVRRAIGPKIEVEVLKLLQRECHPHQWQKVGNGGDSNELFECQRCGKQMWD